MLTTYQKIVRASAVYDLILTAGFALPILAAAKMQLLHDIHLMLALPGSFPEFSLVHLFFVNLTGSVVLVWSILRIRQPLKTFGLYDSLARALFCIAMVYALVVGKATWLLLIMLVPEFLWGAAQFAGYFYSDRKSK